MEKDFDRWNEIKKRIAIGDNPNLFPKTYDFYYNFTDPNNNKGSVILAQVRLVSVKRFIRDMYKMNNIDFNQILARLTAFLSKSKPRF